MGIFQEIERQNSIDYINAMRHLAKRTWLVSSIKQLPRVLQNAHREALSGRPGPVLIDLPMELQVEKTSAKVPDPPVILGRLYPDPASVEKLRNSCSRQSDHSSSSEGAWSCPTRRASS